MAWWFWIALGAVLLAAEVIISADFYLVDGASWSCPQQSAYVGRVSRQVQPHAVDAGFHILVPFVESSWPTGTR
jgi:hypothetical protein